MALNGYARMTVDGSALTGDVSVPSIGGVDVSTDHVEVHSLHLGVVVVGDDGGPRRPGRREFLPVRMSKPTDGTTPLMVRAASEAQRVEARFLLFDNDPTSGETRHRFTVRIAQGRVSAVTTEQSDVLDPDTSHRPVTDHVELVARTIAWVDEVHGVEFEDTVA